MTQNETVNNTDTLHVPPTRRDFLAALYQGSPEELYFELRCIHPITNEVRNLWSTIGDKRNLANSFRQAEKLNKEGFSLYFAPCLRSTKSGKKEAAALVTALWADLDCDHDPRKREVALAKLREFDPAPSMLIDSGGGYHPYWLLDKPYDLKDKEQKQHFSAILRGLSKAVGGDPEYTASPAAVIRLPGSINTKLGRGGDVTILELHSDRRYSIVSFEWLKSTDEKAQANYALSTNGNAYHRLPERTEHYLTYGAQNGSRNSELFAAACQFRDAGYPQSEAERLLVLRYVADGNPNESSTVREEDARATIASAYADPARKPLPPAKETKEDSNENPVDVLVREFGHKESEKHPSAEQIREAVIACAQLDPLLWAEKRKQLKQLCGDAFKAEDLNRMYREARRDHERQQMQEFVSEDRYIEHNGVMVYEQQTMYGIKRKIVAPWVCKAIQSITQIEDEHQCEHLMRLQLQHKERITTIDIPSEKFGDMNALQKLIAGKAGGVYAVSAGMNKHLIPAILKLSGDIPQHQTYGFMGWTQMEGRWTYVAPKVSINADGVIEQAPEVELESRLRDYGLCSGSWKDSLEAFKATIQVFPKNLAPALIAFTLLPLLQKFFPSAAPRPAVHLVGTTGSGKSEIAALMTSFYGQFTRDTPPSQWGDTVNTVETLGYNLANALYWVDDYKACYADERTFTRFLQSYSRGMGRGRLTREAKVRQDRPCRGLLLSTGETTMEGEASILSRMLILDIPPWEKRDPKGQFLAQAEIWRDQLPGFTAHFATWIARQADGGQFVKRLADEYHQSVKGYRSKIGLEGGRQANTGRVVGNWAVLVTVYRMLRHFLHEHDCDELLPAWQDTLIETLRAVQQERAGQIFLDLLGQLLASGKIMLTDVKLPEEPRLGVTIVGYQDNQHVYLLPEVAYAEVCRNHPIKFTSNAIGAQLREDGCLLTGKSENHLTVQMRVRGHRVRVWRLKAEILTGDAGDSGDS